MQIIPIPIHTGPSRPMTEGEYQTLIGMLVLFLIIWVIVSNIAAYRFFRKSKWQKTLPNFFEFYFFDNLFFLLVNAPACIGFVIYLFYKAGKFISTLIF